MKKCSICNIERPLSDYYKRKNKLRNDCKICCKERANKRKDERRAYMKKWRKENPDYLRRWRNENKERDDGYRKKYRNDGHFSVYLLPNENYVGQTKSVKTRMYKHKYLGRDISDYKILHTFDTREEALQKEAEYHAQGYNG